MNTQFSRRSLLSAATCGPGYVASASLDSTQPDQPRRVCAFRHHRLRPPGLIVVTMRRALCELSKPLNKN